MAMAISLFFMTGLLAYTPVIPITPFTEVKVDDNTVCYLDPEQRIIFIDCNETDGILKNIRLWDAEGNLVFTEDKIYQSSNDIYELPLEQLEEEWFFIEINTITNLSWHEITLNPGSKVTRL